MEKNEKQGRNGVLKFSEHMRKRADDLDDDVDALFQLPLTEFTGARNALAAKLKKSGRGDEAARVKALAKPSISAWAVNQLYWNHREAFDQLIASGERFHKAQKSGKVADMRASLDARREVLSQLTDLATSLLRDAGPNPGQNPSLDTIHRITTTLEGMSVYASRSDGPRRGRLTHDVDPPGFESFGSFVPAADMKKQGAGGNRQAAGKPARVTDSRKPSRATKSQQKMTPDDDVRHVEETRKTKITEARVSLQDAKRSLTAARARAQGLEAAEKKADAEAKKAEMHRRDAEEQLKRAKAASEDAARRARSVTVEVEEASRAVDDAERTVEKAAKELESLLRESSGR
jgi:hypothetical protein